MASSVRLHTAFRTQNTDAVQNRRDGGSPIIVRPFSRR